MNKTKDVLVNPALLFGVGLLPLIVSCADLKSALIYAVLLFLTMNLTQLLVGAFRLVIAKRVRFVCYTLAILSVVYFLDSAVCELFPKSYSSLHSIVVLLLASSVVIYSLEMASKQENSGLGFKFVLKTSGSYCLTMVIVGLVKELLGKGAIWGKVLSEDFNGIGFFNSFAGALMILLVLALIYNIIATILKRRRQVYNQLVARYGAVINSNRPVVVDDNPETTEEKEEETV